MHSITGSHELSVCFRLVWLSWPLASSPGGARSSWPPVWPLCAFDLSPHSARLDSVRCRKPARVLCSKASFKGVSAFMF